MKYIISRAFVEFGPFAEAEILDFGKRNLMQEGDYLRSVSSADWDHWEEWKLAHSASPTKTPPKKKAPTAAKSPAKKSAAKKAPKAQTKSAEK